MDRVPYIDEARTRVDGPVAVVHNPRAGKPPRDLTLMTAERALRDAGRRHELMPIRQLPQALQWAQRHEGIIVAIGGDGTANAVAQGALEEGLPFGLVPRGTFNFFARRHGLSPDPAEAMRVILNGSVKPVQVGRVNGRVFLVNASLGLYPKLLDERERYKRRFGRSRWVAVVAGVITLLRERRRLSLALELDGRPAALQASTLFVGNNALQLDLVGADEAQAPERGRLAGVCIRPVSRAEMLGLALRGAVGRLGDADHVVEFSFRALDVAPLGRIGLRYVKVAFDGETAWMRWPLRFEVSPRPLRLIVP